MKKIWNIGLFIWVANLFFKSKFDLKIFAFPLVVLEDQIIDSEY